ncbi:hypothetical protein AZE42_10518 [Rhizopogon vesiculosus]|uniref:Uncharacterized protein n=1 Tax=Rhizopogon vesiculosus TaxID=180088 RepID=A0A1J8QHT9_9AGAM|nr:hypothetical protein AZE42_10518 [Rhizopogon vesiculosus]
MQDHQIVINPSDGSVYQRWLFVRV